VVATEINITWSEPKRWSRSLPFVITTEGVFFALFVCGLAWVPFWLGSNRLITWGINAALFAGLAGAYELSLILRREPHPVALRRVGLSAIMLAVVAMWVFVQNATWTPTAWQHPIWQLASDALGQQLPGSISVDRDLTALALLRLMTSASVFWLALQLCIDPKRARWLIWSVVGIGAIYAAVGLFAVVFSSHGRIFAEQLPSKFVSSTFVNQNHYVTFAGIGLIAAVGAVLRIYRQELGRAGRSSGLKIAALIETTGGKAALPLALALVILAALMFTGSRGGIVATALGLFVLLVLNLSRAKGRNEAMLLSFAALLVVVAFFAFSDVVVGRITARGLTDQGRPAVLNLTIRSILSAPVLGLGYGTFSSAFPMFRDDSVSIFGFWDKAHNTYIEIFQGLGLLFGVLLIASVAVLVFGCLKAAITQKRGSTIPAIAASVSFLVGAHAFIDFSLQIQAVTLTYMAVLGAGVAQIRDPSNPGPAGGRRLESSFRMREPR
jgi:O-antigen ligase